MTSNLSIFENEMSKWIIGCVYLQNEFQTFDFEIICLVNVWDWLQSVRLYIFVYESIKTEKLKSFSEIIEVLQYNRVSKVLFWVSWKYTEYDYICQRIEVFSKPVKFVSKIYVKSDQEMDVQKLKRKKSWI